MAAHCQLLCLVQEAALRQLRHWVVVVAVAVAAVLVLLLVLVLVLVVHHHCLPAHCQLPAVHRLQCPV